MRVHTDHQHTSSTRSAGRRPGRGAHLLTALCVGTLVLTACSAPDDADLLPGGGAGATTTPAAPAAPSPSASVAYPVRVDNCGEPVELAARPERIVTIKSSATEMVLALGAGDRIVGTGFPDGPVPPELAAQAADLPVLSDKVPSAEVVLQAEPDLVMAGWESNLTAEGAGDRPTLAGLGVATYVSPAACKDPQHRPARLSFEDVFAEIREAGRLLGAVQEAADLVASQEDLLETVEPDDRGLTALWYSSGTDIPYVGAGIGAPQMIMDALGLTNIAGEVPDTWASFSWEETAQHDPDLIVLVDSTWNSAEKKKQLLRESPATANLTAVQAERYLVVPFAATEAGVRNVAATVDLAQQLGRLDLG